MVGGHKSPPNLAVHQRVPTKIHTQMFSLRAENSQVFLQPFPLQALDKLAQTTASGCAGRSAKISGIRAASVDRGSNIQTVLNRGRCHGFGCQAVSGMQKQTSQINQMCPEVWPTKPKQNCPKLREMDPFARSLGCQENGCLFLGYPSFVVPGEELQAGKPRRLGSKSLFDTYPKSLLHGTQESCNPPHPCSWCLFMGSPWSLVGELFWLQIRFWAH